MRHTLLRVTVRVRVRFRVTVRVRVRVRGRVRVRVRVRVRGRERGRAPYPAHFSGSQLLHVSMPTYCIRSGTVAPSRRVSASRSATCTNASSSTLPMYRAAALRAS